MLELEFCKPMRNFVFQIALRIEKTKNHAKFPEFSDSLLNLLVVKRF